MSELISLTIDEHSLTVPAGTTILEAAQQALLPIPHLCSSPLLKPFGSCRLCVVQVEGMRGFPTACTTPVTAGMVVHTQTPDVQQLRKDVLQLLLSEHPSSCLFCEENTECRAAMITTRKSDLVTGCRSCPKDGQCELQEVVKQIGIGAVNLPFHYRALPVEKYDPFYDRDYNLCILCGRCVRVCQEVRLANVLTFKERGPATLIGPAFERSHIEAGCEFCGDCVSVCPTGALSEKTIKWAGKPDTSVVSTCPYCSLGCSIELLVKEGEIMGSRGVLEDDTLGQLCVKGRFAVTEVVNAPERLFQPWRLQDGRQLRIFWDEAIDQAAQVLTNCPPERFALRLGTDCTNEDLYIARRFANEVMHSGSISNDLAAFYGAGLADFAGLIQKSGSVSALQKAHTLLTIGLDGRFGGSVIGWEIKKAVQNGASLYTIFPGEPYLAPFAKAGFAGNAAEAVTLLDKLVDLGNGHKARTGSPLDELAQALVEDPSTVIILGPEYLQSAENARLFKAIANLIEKTGATLLSLAPQANLVGTLQAGIGSTDGSIAAPGVLYLIGTLPTQADAQADFVIYQNFASYAGLRQPDLALPSAAFSEVEGTFTNLEGKPRKLQRAILPPGLALPDWNILCRIARKLGVKGFDFADISEIQREMAAQPAEACTFSYLYSIENHTDRLVQPEDSYRGFPLTTWVGGLRSLEIKH